MLRALLVSAFAASSVLVSSLALGQQYPSRPVSVVVPFAPGASGDAETRLYSQKLSQALGQPFVLDFKAGAGGTLGYRHVAKAAPDGHTLLGLSGSFTTLAALKDDLPYDPLKEFAHISLMSKRTTVIAAYPGTPFNNIQEYIAYTRACANPGKVNAGTPGVASIPHLSTAWFHSLVNTKVTFVHYKGTSLTLADIVAGRIDVFFGTALAAYGHLKSEKMKLLAIANAERSPLLPDARTAAEQGVTGYEYASLFGMSTTGGTPAAIVNKLSAELASIAKMPDVIKRIEADGGMTVGTSPGEFTRFIEAEIARHRKTAQIAGIKSEE